MADVARMSKETRIQESMRRSLNRLGPSARSQVEAMLSPSSIAIICTTLVAWAGSHFFGVGEIVDMILLVVGFSRLTGGLRSLLKGTSSPLDYGYLTISQMASEGMAIGNIIGGGE